MSSRTAVLALVLIPVLPGCVVAAVAGATYGILKYEQNEAVCDLKAPVGRVWRASIDALMGRGYSLPDGVERDLDEEQDIAAIDGPGYWLQVEEYPGGRTRLRVRIGTFESDKHKRKASLLIESIESRL
jgi:hypothetical protein